MTRSRLTSFLALGLAAALAAPVPATADGGETVALLPVQDRAGDSGVARAVELVVARELADRHEVLDPEGLRDALRRRRIRSVDDTPPEALRELAAEVGAGRLVTLVLHLAERDLTPRLALSGRSYDGATGEVAWAGFESGSGLDGRTLLGLGVVEEAEELAARLARRLVEGLETGPTASSGEPTVAVLPLSGPLSGSSEDSGTAAAETATEIVRAALVGRGVTVVSPNRVFRALYGRPGDEAAVGWGAVDAGTRRALREEGADLVVTGSVERWETSGDGFEPEPVVTVALRAVDAGSGRILWTGARDRRGWDGETVFRLGRVYDHGTLARRTIGGLVERMLEQTAGRTTP